LDPADIAKKDHLDLSPGHVVYNHSDDENEDDFGTHAGLGLDPLPTKEEEARYRDFDLPEPVLLTDAELALRGYNWVTAKNGDIPAQAVQGGFVLVKKTIFAGTTKEPLYVARAKHGPAFVPGKAGNFLGGCNYSLGDRVERVTKSYQVGWTTRIFSFKIVLTLNLFSGSNAARKTNAHLGPASAIGHLLAPKYGLLYPPDSFRSLDRCSSCQTHRRCSHRILVSGRWGAGEARCDFQLGRERGGCGRGRGSCD